MIFRRALTLLIALLTLAGGPLAAREPGERELFEALALDEITTVRKLLVRGVSSNAVDPEKGPAVVMAAREQSFKSLQVLLESPLTDVNIRNEQGETALMYAVLQGNPGRGIVGSHLPQLEEAPAHCSESRAQVGSCYK